MFPGAFRIPVERSGAILKNCYAIEKVGRLLLSCVWCSYFYIQGGKLILNKEKECTKFLKYDVFVSQPNFVFLCFVGYQGDRCETNIDDCRGVTCSNGGTCRDLLGDYQCVCPEGYTGTHCETDIDECESQPCKYGGTCHTIANAAGYECRCPRGTTGKSYFPLVRFREETLYNSPKQMLK